MLGPPCKMKQEMGLGGKGGGGVKGGGVHVCHNEVLIERHVLSSLIPDLNTRGGCATLPGVKETKRRGGGASINKRRGCLVWLGGWVGGSALLADA